MRALILFFYLFSFDVYATKRKCGENLNERIHQVKYLQGQMSQKGIRGELRDFLNTHLDSGYEISENFIQKISLRHSSGAKYFKNYELYTKHFDKHGPEFPGFSKKDYLSRAQEIAKSADDKILTIKTHNGIFKYIPETNELLVIEKGIIGTLYKPSLAVINESKEAVAYGKFDNVFDWIVRAKGIR